MLRLSSKVISVDLKTLNYAQDQTATRAIKWLEKLADPTKHEEVNELKGFPGYYYWKPSAAIRNICDAEVRVIFKPITGGIEVIAVLARERQYKSIYERLV